MKFPNKVIPYRKSVLSKFPLVLKELEAQDCSVLVLYRKLEKKLDGLSEYMKCKNVSSIRDWISWTAFIILGP